ncbi:MAG: hypothetical protein ACRBBP_02105 [Bdellovibrionales bacterium]
MTDQIFYTEGAGNNFFFTISEDLTFKDLLNKSKEKGVTPDGFIVSKRVNETQLTFDFYNNDGSNVDFCGNALRAVGVCYHQISGIKDFKLQTNVGNLKIGIKGESLVEAEMPKPEVKAAVKIDQHEIPHILSGVPHLVFDQSLFGIDDSDDMRGFCGRVREMSLGGIETYNLTFYKKGTDPIKCVTFERGVEDFTLACGSGALSVATVLGGDKVSLEMPGGVLEISKRNNEIFMLGSANVIEVY